MGNVQAVIQQFPWDYVEWQGDAAEYDQAGYKPQGLTYAPQRAWNEAENYGGAPHMVRYESWLGNAKQNWAIGATEGLLTSFGTINGNANGYPQLMDFSTLGVPPIDFDDPRDGVFARVDQQPALYQTWRPHGEVPTDPNNPKTYQVCTPATFPNCTMAPMLGAGGVANFYDHKTQEAGVIYKESVERAYQKAFLNGGIEALRDVNVQDHSTYDPCDQPSVFEVLFPLVVAAGLTGAFEYYGKPELTVVAGSEAAAIASISIFSFGWNISKGMVEYYHETDNHYYVNAARSLLYPIAGYAGSLLGSEVYQASQAQGNQTYYQIGGGVAGILAADKMAPLLAKALEKSTVLAAIILGGFGFFTRAVSHFWCSITTNLDACKDYENDPTNRRWDMPSIAAMLTLEVCDREGWQKDDPRAEFVFRGLMYGPELMNLPVDTQNSALTAFDQTLINPLGYLYAGRWMQIFGLNGPEGPSGVTSWQRSPDIIGWDGAVTGAGDIANSNLYACENWDNLRNGTQAKSHPGARRLASKLDEWIGTWNHPRQDPGLLVQAANVPANIDKMKQIEGWELAGATPLRFFVGLKFHEAPLENTLHSLVAPPPHEKETLEVLPFYLDYPALKLSLQAPYKRTDPPPPHQRPPTLEVLPFVDINDCAVTWRDDILSGNSRWASYSAAQVQQSIERVLAAPNCSSCDVEDVGKLYALRIALGGSQDLTCSEFVAFLQHSGWSADVIQHAVYTVARTVDSGIPALAQWARDFVAECDNYEEPGTGFAALPASITNKWCT